MEVALHLVDLFLHETRERLDSRGNVAGRMRCRRSVDELEDLSHLFEGQPERLLADTRKGRRPSFIRAAEPRIGEALYMYVVDRARAEGFTVETGEFGAHMVVEIANDGPVTILLDTAEW